jgi:hypothetical protein
MAVFKKRFNNADDYEEWLAKASGRINVLDIKNSPTIFGSSIKQPAGPVIVRYQTRDKAFSLPSTLAQKNVQTALVAAGFLALSIYLMLEG